jgi:hypothetical protein
LTTPPTSPPSEGGVPATRRGGTRREVTARVALRSKAGGESLEGWALNVSRGGVRVILEEKVELGAEFEIVLSAESGLDVERSGRVVWIQEEPDGTIVGIEFLGEPPDPSFRPPSSSQP